MNPEAAKEIFDAWEARLRNKQPTPGEAALMRRYRNLANGFEPDSLEYDPSQQADTDEDV